MPKTLSTSVPREAEGKRLDAIVTELFPRLTRSQAQRLIREGNLKVNGRLSKCSHRVRFGEEVVLTIPEPRPDTLTPEPIPLEILYEDESIVVVNKPPGLVVHPGAGVGSGTLVNALLAHCRDLSGIGGVLRPGIVHRLDKGTSGLLVVAKTDEAHVGLAGQIAQRLAERTYLAIVWGVVEKDSGKVEAPIGRSRVHRTKMAVDWKKGRRAATRFTVLERFHFATYLTASLETGRTHQIRVHFSYTGHPVFGDPQYGGRTRALSALGGARKKIASHTLRLIERPALHAVRLAFAHPVSGVRLSFEAPLPSDIIEVLDALRMDCGSP